MQDGTTPLMQPSQREKNNVQSTCLCCTSMGVTGLLVYVIYYMDVNYNNAVLPHSSYGSYDTSRPLLRGTVPNATVGHNNSDHLSEFPQWGALTGGIIGALIGAIICCLLHCNRKPGSTDASVSNLLIIAGCAFSGALITLHV